MPAAFNGVFSLKPSHGRISFKDVATSVIPLSPITTESLLTSIQSPGQMTIPSVMGIMGPSISTLRFVFKSLLSTSPWLHDPEVNNMPWRVEQDEFANTNSSISFGLLESDGIVTPHPPISRALRIVAAALHANKHRVFKWSPPSHEEANDIHVS